METSACHQSRLQYHIQGCGVLINCTATCSKSCKTHGKAVICRQLVQVERDVIFTQYLTTNMIFNQVQILPLTTYYCFPHGHLWIIEIHCITFILMYWPSIPLGFLIVILWAISDVWWKWWKLPSSVNVLLTKTFYGCSQRGNTISPSFDDGVHRDIEYSLYCFIFMSLVVKRT